MFMSKTLVCVKLIKTMELKIKNDLHGQCGTSAKKKLAQDINIRVNDLCGNDYFIVNRIQTLSIN